MIAVALLAGVSCSDSTGVGSDGTFAAKTVGGVALPTHSTDSQGFVYSYVADTIRLQGNTARRWALEELRDPAGQLVDSRVAEGSATFHVAAGGEVTFSSPSRQWVATHGSLTGSRLEVAQPIGLVVFERVR
ncbi:MAG: hypothetical protein ACTHU0_39535 [Kofleriaceae bacterium]